MILPALAVAVVSTGLAPIQFMLVTAATGTSSECPAGYSEVINRMCVTGWKPAASWYAAEAMCRDMGGHLLAPATSRDVNAMRDFSGSEFWTGRHREDDKWAWSDGRDIPELPTSIDLITPDNADCMAMRFLGDNAQASNMNCGTELRFRCSVGALDCMWSKAGLAFKANLPKEDLNYASQNDVALNLKVVGRVLSMSDADVGIGEWVAPDRFRVKSTELPCTVVAVFEKTKDPSVKTGCEKADGSVKFLQASFLPSAGGVCPLMKAPSGPSSLRPEGGGGEELDKRPLTPLPPITALPPLTETPPDVHGTGAPGQTEPAVVVETRSSIPVWVWPIAFVIVGLVSVVAGVGASRRRAKKESLSSDDDDKSEPQKGPESTKCSSEEGSQCDTCRKFKSKMARNRLYAVHKDLQREFASPLNVVDIRCDHVGNDHIHVFSVANDFDASSLGALSTVYSRTKPRLPRNTRIHIERVSDAELPENQPTCPDQQANTGYDDSIVAGMFS
eukprot:TRINITY_DN1394_c0_g1_i9.p1 TRINITY_DN1394_c0_g1~~TRINITY_DN1394_c0_g1_i9.p1  ORF type:complete len:504 (+),score=88.87 TRINITY_DN1394_c0_g1_i9:42-1553(+)